MGRDLLSLPEVNASVLLGKEQVIHYTWNCGAQQYSLAQPCRWSWEPLN